MTTGRINQVTTVRDTGGVARGASAGRPDLSADGETEVVVFLGGEGEPQRRSPSPTWDVGRPP